MLMVWCSYQLFAVVLLLVTSGDPKQPPRLPGAGVRLWLHGHPINVSSQGRAEAEVSLILSVMLGSHVTTQDDCHKKFNCELRNFLLFHPQICICIPLTTGTNACKVILLGLLGWASHPVNSALFWK